MSKIIFIDYEYKFKGKIAIQEDIEAEEVKELCLSNIIKRGSGTIEDFVIKRKEEYNYERI